LVSVVVPCYRSAATLPALVARLASTMPAVAASYEVILVVDGSPDDTWEVAGDLARRHGAVRAIRLARNYGQHNALIAGVRAAQHEVVVTMDDDLQHRPEEIPRLLEALRDDVDLVYGVPHEEEHGAVRSLASRMVKSALSGPMGVQNAKLVSAFRAFRTYLRAGFDQVTGPDVSVDVCLSWATTRVAAVEVRMDSRAEGESGYTFRRLTRHALNMILGYSTKPLRAVTYLGLLMGLVGLILSVGVLWLYFDGRTTVAGYTTVASMVAFFSSAQMVAIGVLGEYVGRIHASGMGRPTYVISQRVDSAPQHAEGLPAVDEVDVR
jgi:undecaprenyl-phosphate 4-deoxy-4-formamido-L-arabinose transferase